MASLAHDTGSGAAPHATLAPGAPHGTRLVSGLAFVIASAVTFGTSGTLARGLLDTGWTPGAAILFRVSIAAIALLPLGVLALRGRWSLLRRNLGLIAVYGVLAVATAQFCYFSAVQYMNVAPALLIELTAPVAVVGWMWLRHHQRPSALTVAGAGIAGVGLVLVLDLVTGAQVSLPGVLWALGAMVGASTYYVISGDEAVGLPPLTLAAGGLLVAAVLMGALAATGVLPMAASWDPAVYSGHEVPVWLPVLGLGALSAAFAYATGIAGVRRLGSRLASFVGLTEVLAALLFAWLILGEVPRVVQLIGGVLVVAGVVAVRLGEPRAHVTPAREPRRPRRSVPIS